MRRPLAWLAGVALVAMVLVGVRWLESLATRPPEPPAAGAPAALAPAPEPGAPEPPPAGADAGGGTALVPEAAVEPDLAADLSGTWEAVDMEAVRRALPDNSYWKRGLPSDDPRVQAERDEAWKRQNDLYGKVLSGTGSEDEIRAYFAGRQRVSADYVEFATYLLDHYGEELPDRDVGLLELARSMHLRRLEELPRKQEEAFARKREQDAARAAWLAEQAELGLGPDSAEEPDPVE